MTELMLPASEILKMCKEYVLSQSNGPLTKEGHEKAMWAMGFANTPIHEVGRRQNGEPSFEKRDK